MFLILATLGGCKGCGDEAGSTAPDAAPAPPSSLLDPELGLNVDIPSNWDRLPVDVEDEASAAVLSARRRPPATREYRVAPRIDVSRARLEEAIPVEDLLRQTLDRTKAALPAAQARIRRTTTSRWRVGATDVAAFELTYSVLDPKGGEGWDVIQRTAVCVTKDAGERPFAVDVTATFVDEDNEKLGREVETMLRSLHFTGSTP